jgi:hypothetical protein
LTLIGLSCLFSSNKNYIKNFTDHVNCRYLFRHIIRLQIWPEEIAVDTGFSITNLSKNLLKILLKTPSWVFLGLHIRSHIRTHILLKSFGDNLKVNANMKIKITLEQSYLNVNVKECYCSNDHIFENEYCLNAPCIFMVRLFRIALDGKQISRVPTSLKDAYEMTIDKMFKSNLHIDLRLLLIQSGDIETNPGPFPCDKNLILLSQNCRGLNNSTKLKQLLQRKNDLVKNDLYVLALQETYLINEETIKYCDNYIFSKAESTHSAGCLTFLPATTRVVEKRDIDDRGHGHVAVVEGLGNRLTLIGNIYAPVRSSTSRQTEFYETLGALIDELESKYILNEPDLIILGDFNLPFETEMLNSVSERARARLVSEYFSTLGLIDCWKSGDNRITLKGGQSRLDRILYRITGDFTETLTTDWTFTISDHCLLSLCLKPNHHFKQKNRRVTSLPTYILNIREEKQKITEGLNEFKLMINENWSAQIKLEFLKTGLRTVVGECLKDRHKREREELDRIQVELEQKMICKRTITLRAMEENLREIDILFNKRNQILEEKCETLATKAKTKWFHEGEKANKYFLNILRKRGAAVNIEKIDTENGHVTDESLIKEEVKKFYKELYEQGGTTNVEENFFQFNEKIPAERATRLTITIGKEELLQTLKSCKDSAPGPDGIPYSYYKHFWDIFGDILVQSWNESLLTGQLPPSHSTSILRLLPKEGKDLTKLTNWRPITLSNCDHKLFTKCYANRLTGILADYLHPNQTAYLPGKQIQDNLRLIDILNKTAETPVIVALDAKKAFDSVTHDYIRRVLKEYGLENFIDIFNLLYKEQKVDIALNNDIISGYEIKNGVKQGDSLSCILFILCIDLLIRNIENNDQISRLELPDFNAPKILAYADDVTCVTDTRRGVKQIFKEYERLSKASGLILNADKTEILDANSQVYSFKYRNESYRVKGKPEVKINGIIFNKDERTMQNKNYDMLVGKIESALTAWKARRLSLLGKILIYKTFGLSQITYVLTVIDLNSFQYKNLHLMYNNYLWGRDLHNGTNSNRISWHRLCKPVEKGGFGMINFKEVVDGIRCRQLGKMFGNDYNHPLKTCIVHENKSFASWKCLKNSADNVAKIAHSLILNNLTSSLKRLSNEEIRSDNLLIQQIGETETVNMTKLNKRQGDDMMELVHIYGCDNFKEIVREGRTNRRIISICKKIMIAKYLRILKILIPTGQDFLTGKADKIKLASQNYKLISAVTSKEFRMLLWNEGGYNKNKLMDDLDDETCKEYFAQVRRLTSTKHKNTLLRVWNGDCLSYSRLIHYGVVNTNTCPKCGELDTPIHMLIDCAHAKRVWELLILKIPKSDNLSLLQYATGINDTRAMLMLKAEILKYLMHFRELSSVEIIYKAIDYLKVVNTTDRELNSL